MSRKPKITTVIRECHKCRESVIIGDDIHCVLRLKDPQHTTSHTKVGMAKDCPWYKEKR
jgi:hypothetical protein